MFQNDLLKTSILTFFTDISRAHIVYRGGRVWNWMIIDSKAEFCRRFACDKWDSGCTCRRKVDKRLKSDTFKFSNFKTYPWPHRNTMLMILSTQMTHITRLRSSSYFACNVRIAVSWFFDVNRLLSSISILKWLFPPSWAPWSELFRRLFDFSPKSRVAIGARHC